MNRNLLIVAVTIAGAEDAGVGYVALAPATRVHLGLAWAVWDHSGEATLADVLLFLKGEDLAAVGELLRAIALGPADVDIWLEVWAKDHDADA